MPATPKNDGVRAVSRALDGVLFGPSDLAASMGLLGQPAHPKVQQAIFDGIAAVRAKGNRAGILSSDRTLARRYSEAGCAFVAVGVDTTLLTRAAADLAADFTAMPASPASGGY